MKFWYLFLILNSGLAYSQTLEERRAKIIDVLDEEQREVIRLSKQIDNKNPDLILKLADINLEKARLIKEIENEKFLSVSPEERAKKDKDSFFSESTTYFKNAEKYCNFIIQKFPGYKSMGDVYYILAFNYKEFNQEEKARKFLEESLKRTNEKSPIKVKSEIALAEVYYNQRSYEQAIPLYEKASNKNERWWTKDSFNLAWCYFRTKKYDKAISLMRDVYDLSKDKKYVDMRSQASRDLGQFYTEAGRTEDAIKFYKEIGIDFSDQMIKISKYLLEQGKSSQAEKVLEEAAKSETSDVNKKDIYMTQLIVFEKFGKYDQHLKVATVLMAFRDKNLLEKDDLDVLKFHIQKVGAILQKQAVDNTYKHNSELRRKKAEQSASYFGLMGQFEKGKNADVLYVQAETMYGSENFEKALDLYEKTFDVAYANKDAKYAKLSVEGMLACIANPDLNQKTKEANYEKVYLRYLGVDQTSDKAKDIYKKLFVIYREKKDVPNAEKILTSYRKNFPDDIQGQEYMMDFILAEYSKDKNSSKFRDLIQRINNKEFIVTKKYADQIKTELTAIQLADAQESESKGDYKSALDNYIRVFNSPDATAETKKNASYNISLLYLKANNQKQYYLWGVTALTLMANDEAKKFEETFLEEASDLFYAQEFAAALDLSRRTLNKLCASNSKTKPVHYKIVTQILLTNNSITELNEFMSQSQKCSIEPKYFTETRYLFVEEMLRQGRFDLALQMLVQIEKETNQRGKIIPALDEVRIAFKRIGNVDQSKEIEKKIFSFYEEAIKNKFELPLKARDIMSQPHLNSLEKLIEEFNKIQLEYPEQRFGSLMKQKFELIAKINEAYTNVISYGSGKTTIRASMMKIEAIQNFVTKVREFRPEGKDEQYIAMFSKDMIKQTEPLLKDSIALHAEIKKTIEDKKVLSHDNFWFLSEKKPPIKYEYRYIYNGLTMDRAGKK